MSETSQRYRKVAARFTERVQQVSEPDWDKPTPCVGWVARDVVRHVVDTSAYFLTRAGVELAPLASVDEDPLGAWEAARDAVLAALEDPAVANRSSDGPMGPATFEQSVGVFGVGDVLIHTWDLARATGQDETLDRDEVRRLHAYMEPHDELMRQRARSGPGWTWRTTQTNRRG